jgi:hypothetical protein
MPEKAQAGLHTIGSFFNPILDYLQNGFNTVNAWQGLVVALLAVVLMRRWGQVLFVTLGAAVVYILVEHFWPIVQGGATLKLPNVTAPAFWTRLGAVYVGLFIIISMFFAVKSVVLGARGGGGGKKK